MKNYFITLILLIGINSFAQIVANDDVINNVNSANGDQNKTFANNDTLNGVTTNYSTVVTTQISTNNSNVFLVFPVNSNPYVKILANTLPGIYTVVYQICEASNPSNCDTAQITVNVFNVSRPTIDNVLQPQCVNGSNGSIILSGLPTGSWTLNQMGSSSATVSGSGNTYTVNNLSAGYYYFNVKDNTQNFTSSNTNSITIHEYKDMYSDNNTIHATYVDLDGNGIKNAGDEIHYQLSIKNNGVCLMTSIDVVNDVSSPNLIVSGSPISNLPGLLTDDSSITAAYIITQNDINQGFVTNKFNITPHWDGIYVGPGVSMILNPSHTFDLETKGIRLITFIDTNNNGIKDSWEQNFSYGVFSYDINNLGIYQNVSSSNGEFFISEQPTSNNSYDFDFYVDYSYPNYSFSGYPYYGVVYNQGFGEMVCYFPVIENPSVDLSVNIIPIDGPPVSGTTYKNKIRYTNHGSQNISSGTLNFSKDSMVTINSISQSGIVNSTNGFSFTFNNLLPHESREIIVEMLVPTIPTVNIGDELSNSVDITVPVGDLILNNNQDFINQTIVASYDPNNKLENHGDKIVLSTFNLDDYFTYTINFENTGNFKASEVRIEDFLDNRFNKNTIKTIDASHNFLFENNYSAIWTFKNINLEPLEKGYLVFQVKLKYLNPPLQVGDIIPNNASIYFDYNPVIITNTFNTEFVQVLNNEGFENFNLKIYPNPTKDFISILINNNSLNDNFSVSIFDINGKMLKNEYLKDLETKIDISILSKGIYILYISNGKKQNIFKIIKD